MFNYSIYDNCYNLYFFSTCLCIKVLNFLYHTSSVVVVDWSYYPNILEEESAFLAGAHWLLLIFNYSCLGIIAFFFFNAISTISNLAHTSIFFSLCRTYVLSWRNWFLSNRHVLPIFNFDTFFLLAHAIKWLLLFFNYCSMIWNCITKQAQHVYPFVAFLVYFGKWVRIWLKS